MRVSAAFLPILLAVIGCGGSNEESSQGPVDPYAGWDTILSADWTMPGGMEGHVCARRTVEEDIFVSGFVAQASPGTHHALLMIGVPDAPDGVAPCQFDTVFPVTAFGSAAETTPLEFPPGVATKIPKGAQLLLNAHVSNTGQGELSGTNSARIRTIPESEVVERAEHFAAGTQRVQIPALTTTTHTGYCTVRSDVTLLAVAPHMHVLGTHEKVVAETAGSEVTLLDAPFVFGQQNYRVIEPVQLVNGDRLRVECTHENTTDQPVGVGPTIRDEMCMATFYKYPVGGVTFCMDN